MFKILVKSSVLLIFVGCGTSTSTTNNENNPTNPTINNSIETTTAQKIVERHNYYRRLEFTDSDLVWDETLATHAQQWADYLATNYTQAHANSGQSPHASQFNTTSHGLSYQGEGENIAWSSNGRGYMTDTPVDISVEGTGSAGSIDAWANEKSVYNYATNSGTGVVGHYTQVVWQKSTKVGCGKANSTTDYGGEHVVCRYQIAGNMVGEKPYCSNYTLSPFYNDNTLKFTTTIISDKSFDIIKILEDRSTCIKTEQVDGTLTYTGTSSASILSFDAFNRGDGLNQWNMDFTTIFIDTAGILTMTNSSNNRKMVLTLIGQDTSYYFVEAEWSVDSTVAGYTRRAVLKLTK